MQNVLFEDVKNAVDLAMVRANQDSLTPQEDRIARVSATSVIAGLQVTPTELLEEKRNYLLSSRKGSAHSYAIECDSFISDLKEKGIEPIVVLPTKLWDKIVREAGLFTFNNSLGGGRVAVSGSFKTLPAQVAGDPKVNMDFVFNVCFLVTLVATFSCAYFYLFPGFFTGMTFIKVIASVAFAVVGMIASFALCLPLCGLCELIYKMMNTPRKKIVRAVKKAGGIHEFLWPSHQEAAEYKNAGTLKVKFPEPPQDVQDILYKVTQAFSKPDIKLTVDSGAITFVHDPIELMVNATLEEKKVLEVRRLAALNSDPIVTLTSRGGHVVAVLAQYGDFPIEKAAVIKAVEEFSFAG